MNKIHKYPVMELFGPTIQGEGLMSGTITHFLRFGGCGLDCSWCDSKFSVDPKLIRQHRTMLSMTDILERIATFPYAPWLTLTGGDPCLHGDLEGLIRTLNTHNIQVAVETQGELFPEWLHEVDVATFSPKPPSSGNVVDYDYMAEQLQSMYGLVPQRRYTRICIKVVVFDKKDFEYALNVYKSVPRLLYDAFYFTAGTPLITYEEEPKDETELQLRSAHKTIEVLDSQKRLAAMFLEAAPSYNFNPAVHVGCQQHVLLWPDKEQGV